MGKRPHLGIDVSPMGAIKIAEGESRTPPDLKIKGPSATVIGGRPFLFLCLTEVKTRLVTGPLAPRDIPLPTRS